MPPRVRVSPSTQFHTSGATVMLKCHADGVPEPAISWEMNEAALPDDPQGEHYIRLRKYCKTSRISHTLVDNKIVDHSDVVGASPIGAAPTTSSLST